MSSAAEFQRITGTGPVEAQFWLMQSDNDLESAIAQYNAAKAGGDVAGPSSSVPQTSSSSEWARSAASNAGSSRRGPRVATLSDLSRQNASAEDENRLFAGGEKSALAVQGPNRGKNGGSGSGSGSGYDLVNQILQKAKQGMSNPEQAGFEDQDDYEAAVASASNSNKKPKPTFSSSGGFRLGRESDPVEEQVNEPNDETESAPENVNRTLIFWRDGFSIDDGELYRYDEPQNERYLKLIESGRAPLELLNVKHDQLVSVQVMERKDQDYVAPKKQPGFTGQGARLGTTVVGVQPETAPEPATIATTNSEATAAQQRPAIPVSGEGDASVQIRLASGAVRRVRVASDGPVQQLYDACDAEIEAGNSRPYILQTAYPPKKLETRTETIGEAKLAGATVIQRWL